MPLDSGNKCFIGQIPTETVLHIFSYIQPQEFPDLHLNDFGYPPGARDPSPEIESFIKGVRDTRAWNQTSRWFRDIAAKGRPRYLCIGSFWSKYRNASSVAIHRELHASPPTHMVRPDLQNLIFDVLSLTQLTYPNYGPLQMSVSALNTMVTNLARLHVACNESLHIFGHFNFPDSLGWACLNAALQNSQSSLKKLILTSCEMSYAPEEFQKAFTDHLQLKEENDEIM
ncbi:hypothetical protein QBC44DRAFT_371093 [Cladorrhinum sp. PSN332]|nr:hypothetical protein QBC44DRAFT_371093 [Cladorrhinum sp. PSN332]